MQNAGAVEDNLPFAKTTTTVERTTTTPAPTTTTTAAPTTTTAAPTTTTAPPPPPPPPPAPAPAPEPQPVATTYYKNCTEARGAGAAPVHRGDPGYGSHLDRDNDGVGCE